MLLHGEKVRITVLSHTHIHSTYASTKLLDAFQQQLWNHTIELYTTFQTVMLGRSRRSCSVTTVPERNTKWKELCRGTRKDTAKVLWQHGHWNQTGRGSCANRFQKKLSWTRINSGHWIIYKNESELVTIWIFYSDERTRLVRWWHFTFSLGDSTEKVSSFKRSHSTQFGTSTPS